MPKAVSRRRKDLKKRTVVLHKRMIRHLVISGGVVYGYAFYGCLRRLAKGGFWSIDDVRSIYATSIGTLFATVLALKLDWAVIDAYLVDRPWHNVFTVDIGSLLGCYARRGIFDIRVMENTFLPLFGARDMSIDITLREFFEATGIDIHYFSTAVSNFSLVDISHTTHPHWRVVDAVYVSCSVPIFFAPLIIDGEWYADGGFLANYPLDLCLNSQYAPKLSEVLGVNIDKADVALDAESASLFDYLSCILSKFVRRVMGRPAPEIVNQVLVAPTDIYMHDIHGFVNSPEKRRALIEHGARTAEAFLERVSALPSEGFVGREVDAT